MKLCVRAKLVWLLGLCASIALAQAQVYRCDNALYTNQPQPEQRCVPVVGGAVTVIEGTRVNVGAAAPSVARSTSEKVDPSTQQQRDAHALVVLQAELHKAQTRHAELLKEWNQGEPERQAIEVRQPARYQERVAQLRLALQRSEADVLGLQRELARWPAPVAARPPEVSAKEAKP